MPGSCEEILKMEMPNLQIKQTKLRTKYKAHLDEAKERIEHMKERSTIIHERDQIELKTHLNKLDSKAQNMQQYLSALEDMQENTWEKISSDLENSWQNLSSEVESGWEKFKHLF